MRMIIRIPVLVILTSLPAAGFAAAQTALDRFVPQHTTDASSPNDTVSSPIADALTRAADSGALATVRPPQRSLFQSVAGDVPAFFSTDTAKVLGTFTLLSLSLRPLDGASVEDSRERLSPSAANVGNWGGSLYAQAGGGAITYLIGRTTGNSKLAALGGDLLRAQALSQLFVQGSKFAFERQRPDASNSLSFPSGHSASAFATATVLQQYYGWKAGAPAYAFAGFVAASRMASSKHYISDIAMGAGIGIAAGRTVTVNLGHHLFAVGAAPTVGGAMVTFTRH
jgi:membrane-associated phospholipid phosphatase